MTRKVPHSHDVACQGTDEIEALYHDLLEAFYDEEDHERARAIAERLEAVLNGRPDVAGSIRAEEIRSIIAELRGNLDEAIRWRESEIRRISELHSLARDTAGWDYVLRQYDYSDLSDRLDLLAIL